MDPAINPERTLAMNPKATLAMNPDRALAINPEGRLTPGLRDRRASGGPWIRGLYYIL